MRKFDPWPVFFRREWNRNWPFLVGFAVTGTLITKLTASLTEEDAKNSPFVQKHRRFGLAGTSTEVPFIFSLAFISFELMVSLAVSGCSIGNKISNAVAVFESSISVYSLFLNKNELNVLTVEL